MKNRISWTDQLLSELELSCPAGAEAVGYLREHRIHLRIRRQPTAARWTLDRKVEIHPRYAQGSPSAAYALSLVVHEIRRIQQGPALVLSVLGELEAWQAQFGFLMRLPGGDSGIPGRAELIQQLLSLPLGWDRTTLASARRLMRDYAGKRYRVDLLPLYPVHRELLYAIVRR